MSRTTADMRFSFGLGRFCGELRGCCRNRVVLVGLLVAGAVELVAPAGAGGDGGEDAVLQGCDVGVVGVGDLVAVAAGVIDPVTSWSWCSSSARAPARMVRIQARLSARLSARVLPDHWREISTRRPVNPRVLRWWTLPEQRPGSRPGLALSGWTP
jgi:hypothetical protein